MAVSGRPDGWRRSLYRRFRYSPLYLLYARVFRPTHAAAVAADRAFYSSLFGHHPARLVFDVGANNGDMAAIFRRFADRVVCVEVDPDTASELATRFRFRAGVAVEPTAVGDQVGQAQLRRKRHAGFNTLSEKWAAVMDGRSLPTEDVVNVPVTTLDHLIATHGRPDYIKIDVEGYELPVLLGLSKPVSVISFECNLPEFRAETDRIVDRLVGLSSATRFNIRGSSAPGWLLPGPTDAAGLRSALDRLSPLTCDVFALGGA